MQQLEGGGAREKNAPWVKSFSSPDLKRTQGLFFVFHNVHMEK